MWGEVITCGRRLSGEEFRFSKYHTVTEIYLTGKLIVKENLLIAPGIINVHTIGQLEGYTHQASLTCISSCNQQVLVEQMHGMLSNQKHICFGVSAFSKNGAIVRILGYKAEHLYGILKKLAEVVSYNHEPDKIPVYAK